MNLSSLFSTDPIVNKLYLTVLVLSLIIIIRFIFSLMISRIRSMTARRRLHVNANMIFTLIFFILSILVWSSEIRSVALSITALAVAIIIATKEWILCFIGGLYQMAQNTFHLGDRIEIDGVRGDVINRSFTSTTVLEVGPGEKVHQWTGRSITIPNSIFLSSRLINESFMKNYVLHTFNIPISIDCNWEEAERILFEISNDEVSSFLEKAQKYIDKIQKHSHLEAPGVRPRVHMELIDDTKMQFIVRITVPSREKGTVEQKIIRRFLKSKNQWKSDPVSI